MWHNLQQRPCKCSTRLIWNTCKAIGMLIAIILNKFSWKHFTGRLLSHVRLNDSCLRNELQERGLESLSLLEPSLEYWSKWKEVYSPIKIGRPVCRRSSSSLSFTFLSACFFGNWLSGHRDNRPAIANYVRLCWKSSLIMPTCTWWVEPPIIPATMSLRWHVQSYLTRHNVYTDFSPRI